MKISRRNWYRFLALVLVGLIIYDQTSHEDQSRNLKDAVRCLIDHGGNGEFCPKISVDPLLQPSIQKKFDQVFDQKRTTISPLPQDGRFEVQIQTSAGSGIVLGVTLRSSSNYQVVAWRDLEKEDE